MGENEMPHAGGAGFSTRFGRGRVSHGVCPFGCALRTVCIMDEQVSPVRPLDDHLARTGIDGEDGDGIWLGDAEAYAFEAVVHREGEDLRLSHPARLAENQLSPAETAPQPALYSGDRQLEEASQRAERLGCGVYGKRGFRDGRQGGK